MNGAVPFEPPQLYLVGARALFASDAAWLDALARVASALCGAGTGPRVRVALQVRIETATDVVALAERAHARLRRENAALSLYLNAEAKGDLGYDGQHWPERRIPDVAAPRQRAGASVHSAAALERAAAAGAGFAVFGAVWPPVWKDVPGRGLAALAALVRAATIPVLAIGGVTPARVGDCRRAGAAGVAVASGVLRAPDVATALADYITALQGS